MRTTNILVLRLCDCRCALPVESVREILPMAALSEPPGLPPILAGFLILGHEPVPVVRAAKLFGWEAGTPGLYTPLVVLRGASPLSLLVDSVEEVRGVEEEELMPVGDGQAFNGCVRAEIRTAEGTISLLSSERLLLEEERQRFEALRGQVRARLGALERVTGGRPSDIEGRH